MISCNLIGGLGNQLFQIITTIATAIRQHKPFIFQHTDELLVGIRRPTYWESLFKNLKKYTTANPFFFSKERANQLLSQQPRYYEPCFNYIPIPINYNVILSGYFQSYKYFQDVQDQIWEMIDIKTFLSEIRTEFSELLNNEDMVSIHFRMGDYKEKQDCHPVMTYEYYESALDYISEDFRKSAKFLYFCESEDNDDVNVIIEQLKIKYNIDNFVKVDDSIPDWKQMLLMSCCKMNVIGNSSFSWWGAYFNDNPNKMVFYPSIWFGPSLQHNIDDMFPDNWIKIYMKEI